jgi:hypothetical protein
MADETVKITGWYVTRIVREKFQVEAAATKQQALGLAENPFSVEVVRETAKRIKPDAALSTREGKRE